MKSAFNVSKLVGSFEESATLALSAKAKKMAAEGKSIINLGVGEPDFVTPTALIDRAYEAAKAGQTKYTAVAGQPSLRKAIAERISTDYGVRFSSEEVLVSNGGKQSIYHFLQAVLEPGDEVLILSPYWVSFPEMVKLVGAKPVIVRPSKRAGEPDARITGEDIRKAITPKTRLLILNSPSNPSGLVYTDSEASEFLKAIEPHPIWLMSDDTYYTLVYGSTPWKSPLALKPAFKERTCIIGSSSKTYAMTGWRLGWAIAPPPIIEAMVKLQSQVTSNASSLSQAAVELAVGALHEPISSDLREKFRVRRDLMVQALSKIPGLKWMPPDGAFYVFIELASMMKPGKTVTGFATELLEKYGVCGIPGEPFGEDRYLRLSYALSEAQILEGVQRLEKALKS